MSKLVSTDESYEAPTKMITMMLNPLSVSLSRRISNHHWTIYCSCTWWSVVDLLIDIITSETFLISAGRRSAQIRQNISQRKWYSDITLQFRPDWVQTTRCRQPTEVRAVNWDLSEVAQSSHAQLGKDFLIFDLTGSQPTTWPLSPHYKYYCH